MNAGYGCQENNRPPAHFLPDGASGCQSPEIVRACQNIERLMDEAEAHQGFVDYADIC
ncbi:hypothetical protein D3C79_1092760 [compost metagenome]